MKKKYKNIITIAIPTDDSGRFWFLVLQFLRSRLVNSKACPRPRLVLALALVILQSAVLRPPRRRLLSFRSGWSSCLPDARPHRSSAPGARRLQPPPADSVSNPAFGWFHCSFCCTSSSWSERGILVGSRCAVPLQHLKHLFDLNCSDSIREDGNLSEIDHLAH